MPRFLLVGTRSEDGKIIEEEEEDEGDKTEDDQAPVEQIDLEGKSTPETTPDPKESSVSKEETSEKGSEDLRKKDKKKREKSGKERSEKKGKK